jgi:hypothetical protein
VVVKHSAVTDQLLRDMAYKLKIRDPYIGIKLTGKVRVTDKLRTTVSYIKHNFWSSHQIV